MAVERSKMLKGNDTENCYASFMLESLDPGNIFLVFNEKEKFEKIYCSHEDN